MNVRNKLTAFAFIGLISLPTLDQLLHISSKFSSTENRQLSQLPPFEFPHVRSFVRQFDIYYKENFGWRNALFYAYSSWKFNWLEQSPLPQKVVMGKKGWLFLGNSDNKVIDQYRGLRPLSVDSARLITNHLLERQRQLITCAKRPQFYVLIAPNSHTIYPEYLPDYLRVKVAQSRLDVLRRAISQTNLHFIDVRDTLRAAKQHRVVYYQTDTHWNEYGTLVGCATLLNQIRCNYPSLRSIQLSNYHVTSQPRGVPGDLITLLMLQDSHPKDQSCYAITPDSCYAGKKIASIPTTAGFPSTRFTGKGNGKLLLIGDSFSEGMTQYLAGYFRESYFVRDRKLDLNLVKAEQPDIVVVEIVERNLDQLATF